MLNWCVRLLFVTVSTTPQRPLKTFAASGCVVDVGSTLRASNTCCAIISRNANITLPEAATALVWGVFHRFRNNSTRTSSTDCDGTFPICLRVNFPWALDTTQRLHRRNDPKTFSLKSTQYAARKIRQATKSVRKSAWLSKTFLTCHVFRIWVCVRVGDSKCIETATHKHIS